MNEHMHAKSVRTNTSIKAGTNRWRITGSSGNRICSRLHSVLRRDSIAIWRPARRLKPIAASRFVNRSAHEGAGFRRSASAASTLFQCIGRTQEAPRC